MDNATTSIDAIAKSCIAVRLRLLNRVVTNFYDEALRPLGVKVSQLNILVVTAKLGLARPAQVCEILHLDVSTLSRNVERMKAHGWLEVVPEKDARAQPFRLTPQGKRLIEKAVPDGPNFVDVIGTGTGAMTLPNSVASTYPGALRCCCILLKESNVRLVNMHSNSSNICLRLEISFANAAS